MFENKTNTQNADDELIGRQLEVALDNHYKKREAKNVKSNVQKNKNNSQKKNKEKGVKWCLKQTSKLLLSPKVFIKHFKRWLEIKRRVIRG
ncbi:MAG: hypothetical protein RR620_14325 [Clostridium sp.]